MGTQPLGTVSVRAAGTWESVQVWAGRAWVKGHRMWATLDDGVTPPPDGTPGRLFLYHHRHMSVYRGNRPDLFATGQGCCVAGVLSPFLDRLMEDGTPAERAFAEAAAALLRHPAAYAVHAVPAPPPFLKSHTLAAEVAVA